jgi:hypothetical protein
MYFVASCIMSESPADRRSPLGLFPCQPAPRVHDCLVEALRSRRYSHRPRSGMTSSFGMDSHRALLAEEVTVLSAQTSSSLAGQTGGLPH